ncbi:hypothetical protein CEXT_333491 [Caerostris extrusa]|uniref:Uncharacterized protein n=1 Tax=Caerostris extrusa TaxID=172846 RepID=A0AAV4RV13_CAEEX|nr:hypothetical protein CEXT_333491 [Caerostris extrusa]
MLAALRHFLSSSTLIRSWIRKESSLRSVPTPHQQYFYWKEEILYKPHAPLCRDPGDMVSQNIYRAALEMLVKSIKVDSIRISSWFSKLSSPFAVPQKDSRSCGETPKTSLGGEKSSSTRQRSGSPCKEAFVSLSGSPNYLRRFSSATKDSHCSCGETPKHH